MRRRVPIAAALALLAAGCGAERVDRDLLCRELRLSGQGDRAARPVRRPGGSMESRGSSSPFAGFELEDGQTLHGEGVELVTGSLKALDLGAEPAPEPACRAWLSDP